MPGEFHGQRSLAGSRVHGVVKELDVTKRLTLWEGMKLANLTGWGLPGGSGVKNLPANAGDTGDASSIPASEDPLEEEVATHPVFLLENPMDRRVWCRLIVHEGAKSWT